jgi:hypothetical protein
MKKLLIVPALFLMTSASYAGGFSNIPSSAPSVSGSFNRTMTSKTTNTNNASIKQSIGGSYASRGGVAGGNTQIGVITQQSPLGF